MLCVYPASRLGKPMKGRKMARARSYTALGQKIQPFANPKVWLCAALGLGLAACGQVTVPLGSADVETPMLLTGSIPSTADIAYADIGPTDRLFIAQALSGGLTSGADTASALIPWTNPESGNSGTLSGIDTATLDQTGCLGFSTTANTIAGVRIYKGTACRNASSRLLVTELTAGAA